MYDGEIVQIGTPQELFENPVHTFVGYFIGSPGMNLLPCTVEGNVAMVDGIGIPLTDASAALGRKAGGNLELGIRPMYLTVQMKPHEGSLPARILAVEDQGSFRIVTLKLADNTVHARVREDQSIPDDKTWLAFPKEWIRLFSDGRLITE